MTRQPSRVRRERISWQPSKRERHGNSRLCRVGIDRRPDAPGLTAGARRAPAGRSAAPGQAPPVDALHAHGLLRGRRGAGDRARRGLLRLRRARQALPRRAVGAVLREHRPRPRRARRGRGAAGARSWASTPTGATRTRARSSWRRASPGSRRATSTACSSPPAARRRWSRRGSSPRPTTPRAASTRRHKLISRKLAYHGTSMGALTATGLTPLRTPFEPLTPGGIHVANTNSYRWRKTAIRCGRPTRSRRRSSSRARRRSPR